MYNKKTEQYEVRRFFKSINLEVVGISKESNEKAREDLKLKLKKFDQEFPAFGGTTQTLRVLPTFPTGEMLPSPGMATVEYEDGRKKREFRRDRKVQVMARRDLANHLRKERGEEALPEEKK